MKKNITILSTILLLTLSFASIANNVSATSPASPSPLITEISIYGKVIAGVLAAFSAILGLPLVFLTYRKTRAEINKLELEADSLRAKQLTQPNSSKDADGNIRINIENSQGATVHVLADPRFLAPLLLLMDFVFASVILTLADKILSIFSLSIIHSFAIAILSVLLLFPIAKQVLRVRAVLSPPRTPEDVQKSFRQARVAAYTSYLMLLTSCIFFGSFLITSSHTEERYIAGAFLLVGFALAIAIPFLKSRFNKYIESAGKVAE